MDSLALAQSGSHSDPVSARYISDNAELFTKSVQVFFLINSIFGSNIVTVVFVNMPIKSFKPPHRMVTV